MFNVDGWPFNVQLLLYFANMVLTPKRNEGRGLKLTEKVVKALKAPKEGYTVKWDDEIRGLGARITANGVTSFVLQYRIHRRQRVYTIGRFPEWSVTAARNEAVELRKRIREEVDPMGERQAVRGEPTFGDLLDDYLESEEFNRKRLPTQTSYRCMIEKVLRPAWGPMRLKAIQPRDAQALHASLKATRYMANRSVSLASRLFNYAIEQRLLETNPAKGIEHYHEEKRTRFLNQEDQTELRRFKEALDGYHDQNAADALRLLLLTGSRTGELLQARWEHFNLHRGDWTKPSASTKQKKTETIPLSPPAIALLESMKPRIAIGPLFIGRDGKKARVGLRRTWLQVCKAAGLVEVVEVPGKRGPLKRYKPTVRKHDLRHTFASHLVSNGIPLYVVSGLLGHTSPQTTMRYAHLSDTAKRDATGQFGRILEFESAKRA